MSKYRSGGDYAHKNIGALGVFDKSLTQQSQKDDADINNIVRRFGVTGELPIKNRIPLQDDFYDVVSYQEAMNVIRAADEAFAALSAEHRERFNNSPGAFVDFCSNPDNIEELRKMGFAAAKEMSNGEESGNAAGAAGSAGEAGGSE